jgi:hypothetical protein
MPVLTNAPVSNVFVPVGFDDNDYVEVIIHGHFSNSCNKMGPVIGVSDSETREVQISARSLKYFGNECIPMAIPFVQSVKLGQLKAGEYDVSLRGGSPSFSRTLVVAPSTSSTADDNLYAPVDEVDFKPVSGAEDLYSLTVSGIFPRADLGCMQLEEVKVLTFEDVLVVLPIARFEKDPSLCAPSLTPFDRTFKVSKDVKLDLKRDTLIHVRVLNGQSVNKVVGFEN